MRVGKGLGLLLGAALAAPAVWGQEVVANKHLYSETANAAADIKAAEVQARRQHKRILLDFGGNWCGDCQLLDTYYQKAPNAALLAKYYVVVHVDIGHMDKNVDVPAKYGVPIAHGVPALGIIDADGKVVYAEKPKEFEHTTPEGITALLEKWKGSGK